MNTLVCGLYLLHMGVSHQLLCMQGHKVDAGLCKAMQPSRSSAALSLPMKSTLRDFRMICGRVNFIGSPRQGSSCLAPLCTNQHQTIQSRKATSAACQLHGPISLSSCPKHEEVRASFMCNTRRQNVSLHTPHWCKLFACAHRSL